MRRAASAVLAPIVAIAAVLTAIVLTGSLLRDVANATRPASAAAAGARAAAPFRGDVVRHLDALIAAFPGRAGVWIADPVSSAPLYSREADTSIVSASLYKLGVLYEAERRVERSELRYDDRVTIGADDMSDEGSVYEVGAVVSIDEALESMITISDNGTALALWHRFGGDAIEASLARAGLEGLHVTLDANGNTTATPRAIGTFLRLVSRRELVSAAASDRMLERLQRQKINDRLPAELPAGTIVAHKTGNLAGATHDAGIIVTPAGPRIVVVMTWDAFEGASELIAAIGATVYDASLAGAR